ncbi:hypothetical protein BDR04DRAFT_1174399 [Suillus decipiens]|nr:hypothetical protein BDR04DRAFT_1174399 [Suillus decipiens]
MDEFQGALYHSEFHKGAEQFRGKHIVVVGVHMVPLRSPFPDGTPIEELDFRRNSMPLALILQLKISGGTQCTKLLDKELHDGLHKAGFNLTWELSPGGGEVGLEGFLFSCMASGTSAFTFVLETSDTLNIIQCLTLAGIKQGQDISHFDKDGIMFKDGFKLSADVIVLA